jgi:hypothetical protein
VGAAGGCAGTTITDAWVDPRAAAADLEKVVAIYVGPSESLRRLAEEEMAREITGAQVVPGHRVLSDEDLEDRARAEEKLKAQGFKGAIVMRVLDVDDEATLVPGEPLPLPYASFGGFYDWTYPMAYGPTRIDRDRVVRMETSVYSLDPDRLLWAGLSETFNPRSATKMAGEVSKAVEKEILAERVID